MNKRGLELTVTVIVLLIVSVLIFILAVGLLWNWFGKAESLKAEIDAQTEQQILASLRQTNALVSVPISAKAVDRGMSAVFGVGVRNVGEPRPFYGVLSFSGAFKPDGRRNTQVNKDFIETSWLGNFRTLPVFDLDRNQMKVIPVLIKADGRVGEQRQTEKGDYVFNLCFFTTQHDECDVSMVNDVYSNRIYQVTVRVD